MDELNETLENENTEEETGGEQNPAPVTYEPKTITFQEELEGGAKGAVLYPKTIVSQVEGLDAAIDGKLGYDTIADFDFTANHSTYKDGTYKVINGANSPFADNTGVITILKNGDSDEYFEVWSSENVNAFRKLKNNADPIAEKINALYINGEYVNTDVVTSGYGENDYRVADVTVTDKTTGTYLTIRTVFLRYGKTYELSGALTNVRIAVDLQSTAMPDDIALVYNNDITKSTSEVPLRGKTYVLTGESKAEKKQSFLDQVVADGLYTPSDETRVILDGLFMHFDNFVDTSNEEDDSFVQDCEAFLMYTDANGVFVIKAKEGTTSYFTRTSLPNMKPLNNGSGVLYSDGKAATMIIEGPGRIVINSNLGGHALKSKHRLYIKDNPEIYCNVYHDFAHGKTGLYIKDGKFYIAGCHDVFGTNTITSDSDVGEMRIYGGIFYVENCAETVVQADNAIVYPGTIFRYKNVGEGLWLETMNPESIETGKIKEFSDAAGVYYSVAFTTTGDIEGFYILNNGSFSFKAVDKDLTTVPFSSLDTLNTKAAVDAAFPYTMAEKDYKGVKIYQGVITEAIDGGVYHESSRNKIHDGNEYTDPTVEELNATITDEILFPEGTTISALMITNTGLADKTSLDLSNIDFESNGVIGSTDTGVQFWHEGLSFRYSGRSIFGGKWNIVTKEDDISDVKAGEDLTNANIVALTVPAKSIAIRAKKGSSMLAAADAVLYDTTQNQLTVVGTIPFDGPLSKFQYGSNKISTKEGEYNFSSKTGIIPEITLRVGEKVRLYGLIDPVDSTNKNFKWTVAGEYHIIGRTKADDTSYCDVIGLQEGDDYIIFSAKSLTKKFESLSMKVHFKVVAKENNYGIIPLSEEKTELDLVKERVLNLENTRVTHSDLVNAQNQSTEEFNNILLFSGTSRFVYTTDSVFNGGMTAEQLAAIIKLGGIENTITPTFAPVLENYFAYNLYSAAVMLRFEIVQDVMSQFIAPENILTSLGISAAYIMPVEVDPSINAALGSHAFMGHLPVYKEHANASGTGMYVDGTQIASAFFFNGMVLLSAPLAPGKYWIQGTLICADTSDLGDALMPTVDEGE